MLATRMTSRCTLIACALVVLVSLACFPADAKPAHFRHRHHGADHLKHTGKPHDQTTNWYEKYWCGSGLEYLDDAKCQKVFPGNYDRSWKSPLRVSQVPDPNLGWSTDSGSIYDFTVNMTALPPLIGDTNMCVILIRRTGEGPANTYYRHLCGIDDDQDWHSFETWSSSKIYAMANAAGHIRSECAHAGFTSSTTGKHGQTPLGDLASIIVGYDTTAGYTSNSLACYMHNIGWRDRIQTTLNNWYPQSANLSLGGNYGEPAPADLGFNLTNPGQCAADPDDSPDRWNSLTPYSHIDLLRRLVLFEDLPEVSRWPNITLEDTHTILYGAETSQLFPGLQWGGMSTDIDILLQSGLDMQEVQRNSQGQFRIFSKLGDGWSTSRSVGEIVSANYAALPVLDASGQPIVDAGVEFFLVGRASVPNDTNLVKAQEILQAAISNVVKAIYLGQI